MWNESAIKTKAFINVLKKKWHDPKTIDRRGWQMYEEVFEEFQLTVVELPIEFVDDLPCLSRT